MINYKKLADQTIDIKEAAAFLGFKGVYHLREKAKQGKIPGAFKIANRWMFFKDELIKLARNYRHTRLNQVSLILPKRSEAWQSARRKTAPIITPASHYAEYECRNLLDALTKERRKNMKKSAAEK